MMSNDRVKSGGREPVLPDTCHRTEELNEKLRTLKVDKISAMQQNQGPNKFEFTATTTH